MVKQQRNCAQVLFKDSDSLLTMLLLSQAADRSRPARERGRRLDGAGARSYETFRVTAEKYLFLPSRHAPYTRYGGSDMCTYHYFYVPIPATRPSPRSLCFPHVVHAGGKRGALKIPSCKVPLDGV